MDAARDRRGRGPPVLGRSRRGSEGHWPGVRLGHRRGRDPGRLHDHPAVRQERLGRAGQPHRPGKAARGRDRLPPDPQMVQAEDHHRVPEHDLLRQRRLRDRIGRAGVLRQGARVRFVHQLVHQPSGDRLRRQYAAVDRPPGVRQRPAAVGVGAAGRHGRRPDGLRSGRPPACRLGSAPPRAEGHVRAGLHHPRSVPPVRQPAASHRQRHPAAVRADSGALLLELATTPDPRGRRPRRPAERGRVPGVLRGPEDPHDARPEAAAGGRPDDLLGAAERFGVPSASMVAIDNRTGQVRAMVGGPVVDGQEDFKHHPFNLATEGLRQPGSSFKPFTLAMALQSGEYSPNSIIDSAPQDFIVPHSGGKEHFIVHNFGNAYSGRSASPRRLRCPTTRSTPRSESMSAPSASPGSRMPWASGPRCRRTTR